MPSLLWLQRTAGNAAVNGLLARSGARPPGVQRLPAEGGLFVQRDGGDSAGWNAPEDLGVITDRHAARTAIDEVLIKEATDYLDVDAVADQARVMIKALNDHKARIDGEGPIPADEASQLNSLSLLYTGFRNNSRNALLSILKAGLGGLFNPPNLDEANAAVGEAMHGIFMKPNEDKLEAIAKVAEQVKGIGDKAKWVADKATGIASELETAEKFHEIAEKIEKFNGTIEELINIKNIATDMLNVVGGLDGRGSESILGAGDQLSAGIDLVGLLAKPFMKDVPLFGDYWNKYLVPMTKKCIEMLNKLESQVDQINREQLDNMINWVPAPNGWRPVGPPPELPGGIYATIQGGRPVFEYLYAAMQGAAPAMGADVEKVLLAHKESLEKLAGSEMEMEERTWNPLTWFGRKPKDLAGWVAANIRTVWMAFYGGGRLHG
jgi:hypothetical protein